MNPGEEHIDVDDEEELENEQLPQEPVDDTQDDEELPDELLPPEEREAKAARKKAADEEAARTRRRDEDDRLTRVITEAFAGVREAAPAREPGTQTEQPQRRVKLTPEQRAQLNQKILEDPEGLVKLYESAEEKAYQRAMTDFRASTGPAAAILGESVAERFVTRKLKEEALGDKIEPFFNKVLEDYDLSALAAMSQDDRRRTLDDLWDVAAGRLLRQKGKVRTQVSPGVARGAGGSGRMQRRRQKYKMSEKEKQSIYDSLPKTPEGRERGRIQILEIENGVIRDSNIARMVEDSMKFADSTGAAI